MAATPPKPELLLGKDTTPEALDEAALQIVAAVYRMQHGHEPPAEYLTAARELRAKRRSTRS